MCHLHVTWKKYKNWTHLAAPCIYIIVQIGLIAQHTKIVHYISPCATLFFQPSYILLFFCCMFTAVYHSVLNLAMPKCTHNEASSCQVYIIAIPLYCSIQSTLPWSLILIEQHESWIICNGHLSSAKQSTCYVLPIIVDWIRIWCPVWPTQML